MTYRCVRQLGLLLVLGVMAGCTSVQMLEVASGYCTTVHWWEREALRRTINYDLNGQREECIDGGCGYELAMKCPGDEGRAE